MTLGKLTGLVEALMFVSGDPLSPDVVAQAFDLPVIQIQQAIAMLQKRYEDEQSGLQLRMVEGNFQLCTKASFSRDIEQFLQPTKQVSFSQSVMETLSIIAYKQPVTRMEIEEIRGVRCEYAMNQLLGLGIIQEAGRKTTIGRPVLFATTEKFLLLMGLENIEQLPKHPILNPEIENLDV